MVNYRLPACSAKAGRHIEQSCTILDLKGVALSSFSSVYSLVREVSNISQNYYPELLGKMYIINAPMLFTAVWSMVKPLLDEVTVKKISILGYSYTAALLETIDEDVLPDFLGGKDTCPGDYGPWNDGSVSGYPQEEYERVNDFLMDFHSELIVYHEILANQELSFIMNLCLTIKHWDYISGHVYQP